MFLTWTDHVQACAAELGLSLGDVRGLLVGSWVVPGGAATAVTGASGAVTTPAPSVASGASGVAAPAASMATAVTATPTTTTTAVATAGAGAAASATTAPTATTTPTPAPTTSTPTTTPTATPTTPSTPTIPAPVPKVVRRRVGGFVYEYISSAGYRVVVDTCTRTVLKVEYDLDSGALGGWVFTPHAIEDCKALRTAPVVVVGSLADAQPCPAAGMRTLYRGFYDVLVDESQRLVIAVRPAGGLGGALVGVDRQGVRRVSGGSPVGSMPTSITELLGRARKAGFAVSVAGSGHYKIWGSGVVGEGVSVTVPATGSDYRGLRNAVMRVRSVLGVDVRLV